MIIKSLELRNFRNYENLSLTFDAGTNIFYGDNAQGKTNILEAVYVSGTTKSHKGCRDRELIRFGESEAHLRSAVMRGEREYAIDMHIRSGRSKGIAIDRVPIKKAADLFGILNIVFFSPEDLNIIKNGPSERRRFLDATLCQLDRIYLSDLAKYNKTLQQRNRLLKDLPYRPELRETLPVWDMQLVAAGRSLIRAREGFIRDLAVVAGGIHGRISGQREELDIRYEPCVRDDEFEEKLSESTEKDIKMCQTTVGPHRDDILFSIAGADIRKFGSQGQQRTTALSLKLSEIELIRRKAKEPPVLLLDDVLSELDGSRQNYLLSTISGTQTLITCTGLDEFVRNRFEINRVFKVAGGRVEVAREGA